VRCCSRTAFSYCVVGGAGTVVYLVLLAGLVELAGLAPVIASIISYIPVFFFSYFLSYIWVFRSERNHSSSFIRYIAVTGVGFLINTGGMYLVVHVFEWMYLVGQCMIFVIVAINNYMLNRFWAFSQGSVE